MAWTGTPVRQMGTVPFPPSRAGRGAPSGRRSADPYPLHLPDLDAGRLPLHLRHPGGRDHPPFRADVKSWDGVEIVEVPYGGRRRDKPKFRAGRPALLRERRFSLIHSHGIQAAIPAIFANLGIGLPHVITSARRDCPAKHVVSGPAEVAAAWSEPPSADVMIPVSHDCAENHLRISRVRTAVAGSKYSQRHRPGALSTGRRRAVPLPSPGTRHWPRDVPAGLFGPLHGAEGLLVPDRSDGPALLEIAGAGPPGSSAHRGSGDCLVNYRLGTRPISARQALDHVPRARSQRGADSPRVGPAGDAFALGGLSASCRWRRCAWACLCWEPTASDCTKRLADLPSLMARRMMPRR